MNKPIFGLIAAGVLGACTSPTSTAHTFVAGVVTRIVAGSDGSEVLLKTAELGDIYFLANSRLNISLRSGRMGPTTGSAASLVVGDSVNAWYPNDGVILDSKPPIYPIDVIEIVR